MNRFGKFCLATLVTAGLGAGIASGANYLSERAEKRRQAEAILVLRGKDYHNLPASKKLSHMCENYDKMPDAYKKLAVAEIEELIRNEVFHRNGDSLYGVLFPEGKHTNITSRINPELLRSVGGRAIRDFEIFKNSNMSFDIEHLQKEYWKRQKNIKLGFDMRYVDEHPGILLEWKGRPGNIEDGAYLYANLEEKEQRMGQRLRNTSYKEEIEAHVKLDKWRENEIKQAKERHQYSFDFKVSEILKLTRVTY